MIFNKSYLTTFSKNKPYLALASKGKIIDSKFTLSSELSLYDYSQDVHYAPLQTDSEYCKLEWCEKDDMQVLACGHTNGTMGLYEPCKDFTHSSDSFKLIKNFEGLTGKVLGINYNPMKNCIAAGSANGNIMFFNLEKLDQQYKCDIPISENITSLAWNNKVSRILCAGTECGKILILDIRAKNIAMTIQNKDIKYINNVKWHPKSSTSIFASTNLPHLVCFKLDSNSLTNVGKFNSSTINFDTLTDDTIVCYSDNEIDYIDSNTLEVRDILKVENVFDISFSQKDPIYCCSYNSGTTEVFTKLLPNISKNNLHVQINNFIVEINSKQILKIKPNKLEINLEENLEEKLIDILFPEKVYKFNEESRQILGKLFLENEDLFKKISPSVKIKGIEFDLNDEVIKKIICKDFENFEIFTNRNISLDFVLKLLNNKEIDDINDPIEFLLNLSVHKNYDIFYKKISSSQWYAILAILMFSDLDDRDLLESIRSINKELQISIINLITNDIEKYSNYQNTSVDLPDNIFDTKKFYEKTGKEILSFKNLNLSYDNPLVNEYFWYAKNHGKYEELKDINFTNKTIKVYLNKSTINDNINISKLNINSSQVNINSSKMNNNSNTNYSQMNIIDRKPMSDMPKTNISSIPKPSIYGTSNRSMTSFSTKPTVQESSPPTLNKPCPPKKSLYSGIFNRSATSLGKQQDSPVKTYGQQKLIQPQSTPSIPKPFTQKTSSVPQPTFKSSVPETPVKQTNYDAIGILSKFEKKFEELKEKASKKNNLIVGNKVKDAVRRFQVFQQVNKNEVSDFLLEKINQILAIIDSENDKNFIKLKVRGFIEECSDVKEQQSDIWIPAIGILVQLVY